MESFEAACKFWDRAVRSFVEEAADLIGRPVGQADWTYSKRRTRVCDLDETGRRKRCAGGMGYLLRTDLRPEDAEAVWAAFQRFAAASGLGQVERLRNNEEGLSRYHFQAENGLRDALTCTVDLPGEWNSPHIGVSFFVGFRYRAQDMTEQEKAQ